MPLGSGAFFSNIEKTTYLTLLVLTPFQAILASPRTSLPPWKRIGARKAISTRTCIVEIAIIVVRIKILYKIPKGS
jgi:hypothetical protein